MVAPGKYDFFEGKVFKGQSRGMAALVVAIQEEVKRNYDRLQPASVELDRAIRVGYVVQDGTKYGFAVTRKSGNKVYLLLSWDTQKGDLDLALLKSILNGGK